MIIMSRIFITGGAGFIGTFLSKNLVENGHDVVVFDSFVRYLPPKQDHYDYIKKRLDWLDRQNIRIVRGDTRNKSEVFRAIDEVQPDLVVHLAALPIADICNEHSEEAVSTILGGTVNVLESIRDVPTVKRFVYASSSMVYGDLEYRPADEAHPKDPKGVYGGTKLAGETITRSFSNQYDIEHVIVRPSAVYGPTDANRRVTQIFIENALQGNELELHNGGKQKLDFTFVKDTAKGFALAALTDNAANETFNITRGEGRSIKELASVVGGYFDDIKIIERETSDWRPERGAFDISKAGRMLGYEPEYSLEDGIQEYVEFVRETFEKPTERLVLD